MKKWIVTAVLALALTGLTPAAAWADASEGDAQTVNEGDIVVGDGVTATYDEETGAVVFYSDGGTLWRDWFDRSGIDMESVKSIKSAETSGKLYLPKDSRGIFSSLWYVEKIDLSGFDTSNATNMSDMFAGDFSLQDLDLSTFNTSNVNDMSGMFVATYGLQKLEFTNFDTSKVTDMSKMFYFSGCRHLDLSGLDTENVTNMESMFFLYWNWDPYDDVERNMSDGESFIDLSPLDMSSVTRFELFSPQDLSKIKTPVNVAENIPISPGYIQPASAGEDFKELDWMLPYFDSEGNAYNYYPKGEDSILLMRFRDVSDPSAWYHKAVYWAYANDVTSGYGEGTFKPNAPLTRAQAVTFLYKFAGKPDVSGLEGQNFTDVAADAWYHDAVKWASANGITKGYGEGTFRPDAPCTRAMIVSFLTHYAKLTGSYVEPTDASCFTDVADNAWYKTSVDWAVANGITSGYGQGTFRPNAVCNRAMMVTFLKSLSELSNVR